MNRYSKWMLPFAWVLVFSTSAFAQSNAGRLNNRLDNRVTNQEGTMEQGEQPGELTHKEGRRVQPLGAPLNHKAQTKVDGNVAPENRNRLKQQSNQAGKKIDPVNRNTQAAPASR